MIAFVISYVMPFKLVKDLETKSCEEQLRKPWLIDKILFSEKLGLMALKVISNPKDSIISQRSYTALLMF